MKELTSKMIETIPNEVFQNPNYTESSSNIDELSVQKWGEFERK